MIPPPFAASMAWLMSVDAAELDDALDYGTGLSQDLAGLAHFVDAAAAIAGPPGLATRAPPAAVTPEIDEALVL